MVKSLFVLLCLSFSLMGFSQTSTKNKEKRVSAPNTQIINQPKIESGNLILNEDGFDFGKIIQGKPVTHTFEITNTGKTPLTLENVHASCGCTTPEWSKEPIAPGATAKIVVGYNAAAIGTFNKSITIYYDGNKTKEILIKGEVWKAPETSAPENKKLKLLKNEQ